MFIPSIKVYWGTDTIVRAEKNLMEAIFNGCSSNQVDGGSS
jgi:hypothetical protein